MNRTFVIGDIHGAFKALLQVIERAGVDENDQLIFSGDFVDGWSQSFEVIQYLADLEKKMACIFIRGNHDLCCQHWLEQKVYNDSWVLNEGKTTVKSYQQRSEKIN